MNDNKNNKDSQGSKKLFLNLFYIFLTIILLLISVSFVRPFNSQPEQKPTYSDLIQNIRDGKVSKISVTENKREIKADIYNTEEKNRDSIDVVTYPNIGFENLQGTTVLENLNLTLGSENQIQLGTGEGQIIYEEVPKSVFVQVIESPVFSTFVVIAIFIFIAFFLIRRVGDVNNRNISFGSSRAKSYDELDVIDKVSFDDVAGNEEAKQELTEVVDFLKRPEEYIKMGAKIPRGVLLIGQPGNGKTLIAKAVAGEAGVPFFVVSGSEFVEMFVGVGAGRVRDLFKKAKKKSPCVIFIDEIDAVGRKRGVGLGGGNDEREQTLNQILVEMDGFENSSAVIVLAATNRPDVLDPALLRPGRFDRQVTVTAPDRNERLQILKVHSKNKKLAKDVDLEIVARRTSGFSGADLMNVLNEAAILTVRENKKEISNNILREAIEKVMLGPSLKSKIVTEDQKKLTAYHEGGHALVATVLPKANNVQKITIIPRGRAGGYTFSDQGENDPTTITRDEFLAQISVLFGGYTVEEQVFGVVSTGASNDLAKATEIARSMVVKYGMSSLGPISFADNAGMGGGEDVIHAKPYSEDTARQIDVEVIKILEQCRVVTKDIIKKYKPSLDKIANALIEKEVIEYEEFDALVYDIKDTWK